MANRSAVLLHGLHLEAADWDLLMWGQPQKHHWMGRIPRALLTCLQCCDDCYLIIGSGASHASDGRSEAAVIRDYLQEHVEKLLQFKMFAAYLSDHPHVHLKTAVSTILDERLHLLETASNTRSEIWQAMGLCCDNDVKQLFLVSSPLHTPRCLRDALWIKQQNPHWRYQIEIMAVPAETYTENSTANDVLIVEPPHRPDCNSQLQAELLGQLRQLFTMSEDQKKQCIESIKRIVDAAPV